MGQTVNRRTENRGSTVISKNFLMIFFLLQVLVLSNRRAMLYCIYIAMEPNENDADEVAQYAKLVGMKCARRMLLVRT